MTDYTELVKALTCGNDGKLPCHNNECPYWVDQWHGIGLCNVIKKDADAAAAIEALQAQLPKRGEWVLTNDEIETIRIHMNAIKEQLCNQYRHREAEAYQTIVDKLAKMEAQE